MESNGTLFQGMKQFNESQVSLDLSGVGGWGGGGLFPHSLFWKTENSACGKIMRLKKFIKCNFDRQNNWCGSLASFAHNSFSCFDSDV